MRAKTTQLDLVGITRIDNIFSIGTDFKYVLNRNLYLGRSYAYQQWTSTAAGGSYGQSIAMVWLSTHSLECGANPKLRSGSGIKFSDTERSYRAAAVGHKKRGARQAPLLGVRRFSLHFPEPAPQQAETQKAGAEKRQGSRFRCRRYERRNR